ncbi:multicopper oxidase family protein [Raineyella fluvialis]|uniref:multicopper oxidase family protein n=1 Tax=Raineyella fluvialis TaxID=2662261 RepID=UPI00188FD5CC|nr:multicopper oxidase domain-containing protein [Raineyella fluvialis]
MTDNLVDITAGGSQTLTATLVQRQVHSQFPKPTTLFGYTRVGGPAADTASASYLGPILMAKRGHPVTVNYVNNLHDQDYLSVFGNANSYTQWTENHTGTGILTHLHGGFVAGVNDGNPFASSPAGYGSFQTADYPNEQPAAGLWFHDHLLGATRLNVVAGLAGGYLLRDDWDSGSRADLPQGPYELPLVIQDRRFNADGSLLYPTNPASLNGPWIPEYFGDVMLVNGKVWPHLDVEPAVYRFRFLNGCNARIMSLKMNAPMFIIGTELGLRPTAPLPASRLTMAPAERFDVLVDFTRLAGKTILLQNSNPPTPISNPAPNLSQVMQFRVKPVASGGALKTVITTLPPPEATLTELISIGAPNPRGLSGVRNRMITLNEVGANTPSWTMNLNGAGYMSATPHVEQLNVGEVEDWYYVNTTPDTHPMHTHLFGFTVLGRYTFDVAGYVAKYGTTHGVPRQDVTTLVPFLKSALQPPAPEEAGFKDTVKANPGQVTVVRAKFSLPTTATDTPQRYVHHCHIVEHEDNDMMERFEVS